MEEPKAMPFRLPPGCRFYPAEEELLHDYLAGKNAGAGGGARSEGNFSDHIRELELYKHDPFDLPSSACYAYGSGGRKTHWFCYVGNAAAAAAAGRGSGAKRRAKSGFWRRKVRSKAVVGRGGKGDLGTRTTFVFYLGNSSKTAVKTDWILYEYAPIERIKEIKLGLVAFSIGIVNHLDN
uniref:NAC domain-containing protein n=1 Tax=Boehmeria nivea TaxID=83906 RepID=A0A060A125_BOENI|nr:NAC domain-containing protein [Boehmeria nivea]